MTLSKKVLSIVLCLTMLLGTLTIGSFFAFAEDSATDSIPSYESLCDKYGDDDFFYSGIEVMEEGVIAGKYDQPTDGTLTPGQTVQVNFYVKSNKDVYTGTYYVLADKNFFSYVASSAAGATAPTISNLPVKNAKLYKEETENDTVVKVPAAEIANSTDATGDEIANNWACIRIQDNKNATTARSVHGDKAIFSFKLKVSDKAAIGDYTVAGKLFLVADTFSAKTGSSALDTNCTIDGSATTKIANCEFTGEIADGGIAFNLAYTATFVSEGKVIYSVEYKEGAKITPPEVDDLYGWVIGVAKTSTGSSEGTTAPSGSGESAINPEGSGANETATSYVAGSEIIDFNAETMGKKNVIYLAILNSDKVTVKFDANGGTINGEETTEVEIAVSEVLNLDDYTPVFGDASFSGWSLNGTIISGEYKFTSLETLSLKAKWGAQISVMVPSVDQSKWVEYFIYDGDDGKAFTKDDNAAILAKITEADGKTLNSELDEIIGAKATLENLYVENEELEGGALQRIVFGKDGTSAFATFGETERIYVGIQVGYTVNKYVLNIMEDGTINPEEKYNCYETLSMNWVANNSTVKFVNDIYGPLADFNVSITEGEAMEDTISPYTWSIYFHDGNGKEYTFDRATHLITLSPDTALTEGKFNTFDFYTDATERVYRVAFEAGRNGDVNKLVSDQEYKFGDTIDVSSFKNVYRANVIGEGAGVKISLNDLYNNGAPANCNGYRLTDIYYNDTDGNKVSIVKDGGTLTIDEAAYDNLFKDFTIIGESSSALVLESEWDAMSYSFTVVYQNAKGEWKLLNEKSFKGDAPVTYESLVTSDLQAIIDSNLMEGCVQVPNYFTLEDGTNTNSIFAYQGPAVLKIYYISGNRYTFIDYANSSDEYTVGYDFYSATYGDVIYNPDYDPESENPKPVINSFLDSFKPTTTPGKVAKTDKDGNPLYSPLYKEVVDEEGNVVIDAVTGEPQLEIAKDEEGNTLYDTTKPLFNDPKGEDKNRPYRNCEYAGYKVYHVNGAYVNYSDLPDESEWLEGFENDECRLYNTVIVKVIWKPDSDFKYRVYNTSNELFSAKGVDGKWYYWSNNVPCKKGEGTLNSAKGTFILMLNKTTETAEYGLDADGNVITGESKYYTAFSIGLAQLSPAFIPDLIPTIISLVKGLIS